MASNTKTAFAKRNSKMLWVSVPLAVNPNYSPKDPFSPMFVIAGRSRTAKKTDEGYVEFKPGAA